MRPQIAACSGFVRTLAWLNCRWLRRGNGKQHVVIHSCMIRMSPALIQPRIFFTKKYFSSSKLTLYSYCSITSHHILTVYMMTPKILLFSKVKVHFSTPSSFIFFLNLFLDFYVFHLKIFCQHLIYFFCKTQIETINQVINHFVKALLLQIVPIRRCLKGVPT